MDNSIALTQTTLTEGLEADPENALVERARTDPAAFAVLYRRHAEKMASYLLRRTGDRHATEDLLSELFLVVYRGLPRYRHLDRPFHCWLFGIATRLVWRWMRKNRRVLEPVESAADVKDSVEGAAVAAEARDECAKARALLRTLPAKQQDVLALFYLEGLGVEEVAAALGVSPGTVKSRLSRARERLRANLERSKS